MSCVHILEAKIQRKRLKDMKCAAQKRDIDICEHFSPDVTHLVTAFTDIGAVMRKLDLADESKLQDVEVVSVQWFTDCMVANKVIKVEEKHRIKKQQVSAAVSVVRQEDDILPDYACQRRTPLLHHNHTFTRALEVVEKHAEFRDTDPDYSRALAFRRASCVLKALQQPLTSMHQLHNLTHIGNHSKKIIQEILEEGESDEVLHIIKDPWFKAMKVFTGVFGIGNAKAKDCIAKGWSSIDDVKANYKSNDWRIQYGLAFHDDLTTPVTRDESVHIADVVRGHLNTILPGAIMTVTGGFSRGKPTGHDVDILITHPVEEKVNGALPRLLKSLESHDIILCGRLEHSTFREEYLRQNTKLTSHSQLDHFEKWIGIIKVPDSICKRNSPDSGINTSPGKQSPSECNKLESMEGKLESNTLLVTSKQEKGDDNDIVCAGHSAMNGEKAGSKSDSSLAVKKVHVVLGAGEKPECGIDLPPGATHDPIDSQADTSHGNAEQLAREPRDWIARRVDLIIAPYSQYYYALVGWKGSKQFNRDIRTYADREVKMKLSSHGLYDFNLGRKLPAHSERDVFDNLKLKYIEPENRNC